MPPRICEDIMPKIHVYSKSFGSIHGSCIWQAQEPSLQAAAHGRHCNLVWSGSFPKRRRKKRSNHRRSDAWQEAARSLGLVPSRGGVCCRLASPTHPWSTCLGELNGRLRCRPLQSGEGRWRHKKNTCLLAWGLCFSMFRWRYVCLTECIPWYSRYIYIYIYTCFCLSWDAARQTELPLLTV